MKKKLIILLIMFIPFIGKAYTGMPDLSVSECKAFADTFKNISGSYEYKYCKRAACSAGENRVWTLADMGYNSGYRCANGNPEPYVVISNGCSKYTGTCVLNSGYYCTIVHKVNCDKKKDGSAYSNQSQTQTQTQKTNDPVTVTQTQTKTKKSSTKTKTVVTVTTESTTTTTTTTTEAKSNNTRIGKITINGQEQPFNNDINEYDIQLPYGKTELDINVEAEDGKSKVNVIGAKDMPNENTDVYIIVTAEDGSEKYVTFHIKRYYGKSEDCTLKYIAIENYELKNFDPNTFRYTLKVNKKLDTLNFDIAPNDALHAEYEIIGNTELKNKSVITINVTAENGDLCTYNIVVKKPSGIWIPIIIIIVIVGVLIGIGYYVYGYFKRSKDLYKYE